MSTPSPYEILGVAPTASLEEIKIAYRRAARATHPDLGGSEDKFKEVQRAFQQLNDLAAPLDYEQSFPAPGNAPRAGFSARPFDERLCKSPQQPKAQLPTEYVPPLSESSLALPDKKICEQRVHGEPRKRGLFSNRSRLLREAQTINLLAKNVMNILPAARLVNGLRSPASGHYDHVLFAGYRMAVINTMTLPDGYYSFDGNVLRHGNKLTQPPQFSISGMQRQFMQMNVVAFTLVLSANGNHHEPVIEYRRNADPTLASTPNVLNAAGLIRELKLFLGSGPSPNVVDRLALAKLREAMY
ncbi:J domain-containing protein [Glutamicibacter mysorens]|uniref:J domain-containing protein n=1 Tax=Glutamicibacter mysorens TaxID=257984 RepID=UPI0020C5E4A7|nr:DnaJ domain-containing protein [Glutamicibacter mysorens]UTM46820.1 DnaJ domain-containing protein [Glutamicibacter mysorens]